MFRLFGDDITDFIKAQSKAVVATVDPLGQPSTSVIFYLVDKNDELLFISKSQTVKSENLANNNRAALTIVDGEKPIAVNLTGFVSQITDLADRDLVMQKIFKLSYSELHDYAPIIKLHKGSFVVFKFTPEQAKMTDFTKPLGKVKEDLKNY